jgi:ferrous iron transport protein B
MSTATEKQTIHVALIGNPNVGKSTLFSALAGVRQRVGNYPGVTVEKKVGRCTIHGKQFELIDLPGTYSLAPRSPDEMIAVDVLLDRQANAPEIDVILCIVDASNLQRNLYLVSQVRELGKPVVLALNMIDLAEEKGIACDLEALRRQLPVTIVPIQAHRREGLDELRLALAEAPGTQVAPWTSPFPEAFQQEVASLEKLIAEQQQPLPRYLVERLLLDVGGYLDQHLHNRHASGLLDELAAARARLSQAGCPVPAVEAMARYSWVGGVLEGVVTQQQRDHKTTTDKIDDILTHRIWGLLFFIVLMAITFQAVFYVAEPASMAIDWLQDAASAPIDAALADGALKSLLIKGVIAGVGGVLVFLPQIFVLFLFIAILEDCGYMARAAYLMDRLMSRLGLSGKSFVPMLSSFACAVPGVMATRVIENPRDRLTTILVAPLMSCSARLPVYALLIAAFIPKRAILGPVLGLQGVTMLAMYSIGIVTAAAVAWLLKSTILRGPTPPFVMELPSYKMPSLGIVLHRMFERGWAFVKRAGTLIFAVSVLVWAAAYYPRAEENIDPALRSRQSELQQEILAADANPQQQALLQEQLAVVNNRISGQHLRHSFLGRAGQFVEPVVRPLGWDWRIGCAAIASFPAREVIVATLGVIFELGEDNEGDESLHHALQNATWEGTDRPLFNVPVALSVMVFFALCAQCAATLAVIKRETNSWRWPIFTFVYMTGLAYVAAMAVYQIGIRLV